jgi:hypothetical protein
MSELIAKVLQMTRLESGALALERDWCSINEIAASVVRRLKPRLADHLMMVDLPSELPLVRVGRRADRAGARQPAGERARIRRRARWCACCGQVEGGELVVSVEGLRPGCRKET